MSNKHKKPLSPEEALQKREARVFHRKIRKVFCDMGFSYIATEGREFSLGNRRIEIDAAYIKDNIVLLCEDTVGQNKKSNRAHVMKKQDAAEKIKNDQHGFLNWFKAQSPVAAKLVEEFGESRIKIFSTTPPRPRRLLKRKPTSVPINWQFFTRIFFTPPLISLPTTKPP